MLAEIFVFALGFVVSYNDFLLRSFPPDKCLPGGNERNKNRVHFVVFHRLYVRREL